MTEVERGRLLDAFVSEQLANQDTRLDVSLTLPAASAVIACVQLALRHPGNQAGTAEMGRGFVEALMSRMRAAGFNVSAEVARLGFDPSHDIAVERRAADPAGSGKVQ